MTLTVYSTGRLVRKEDKLLSLKKLAKEVSAQCAIYYYLWLRHRASLGELHRIYSKIAGRVICPNTVRKQLKILERKGLVKRTGNYYMPLVEPEEVLDLFDTKRSRAGRKGALKRSLGVKRKKTEIPPGLDHYVKKVVSEAKKLIAKGDRTVALDLLTHTLLPLRETEALWLWHRNTFIYWNSKSHNFRAVESKEIADLLRKLGYREGIMIFHTLAHRRTKRIIRRIFARGPYSWPWARAVAYGLKELGLLKDTANYRIQIKKTDTQIILTLYDLYTKQQITEYTTTWTHGEPPEPMTNQTIYIGTILGKAHVKQEIEEGSYFSKWGK